MYTTKQRKLLTEYFEMRRDIPLSAEVIECDLLEKGISRSAVYRNLLAMEKEGLLRRSVNEGSRTVFYRYVAGGSCGDAFHFYCRRCGRTFHAGSSEEEALTKAMEAIKDFFVDKQQTVIYGICGSCRREGKE